MATKPTKELIIEALFRDFGDARSAINIGIVVDGLVFKASSSNACGLASLTRVHLDFLNIPTGEALSDCLLQSFRYYGKVYQIKKFTTDGFFEGLVSVLIDNTDTYEDEERNQVPVKPLSRMLYLQALDNYVSATFRGAPPVCYYCRQAGHIRSKCLILAKKECYRCGTLGHTARVCKEKEQEENVTVDNRADTQRLDDYQEIQNKQQQREGQKQIEILKRKNESKDVTALATGVRTKKTVTNVSVATVIKAPQHLDSVGQMYDFEYDIHKPQNNSKAPKDNDVHYTEGSAASKWASEEVASKTDYESLDSALFNTQDACEVDDLAYDNEKNSTPRDASNSSMTPTSPTPDPALKA
ncbi:unnamed protein product [Rhizopus stolonifer]